MAEFLRASDVISGTEGVVYGVIDGRSFKIAEVQNIEVEFTYQKEAVKVVGYRGTGQKIVGYEITGSMEMQYMSPHWRRITEIYQNNVSFPPISITITNSDAATRAGTQTVSIDGVIPDSTFLAMLDAENILQESMNFTADSFRILTPFNA